MANYLLSGYWTDQGAVAHHYDTTSITFNLGNLTLVEQQLAISALNRWHDIANVTFVPASGTSQINFNHDGSGASASTNSSWDSAGLVSSSTVDITQNWVSSYGTSFDSYSFQTYVHEIGHALGLGHAGNYNGSATYGVDNNHANDTWQFSVMSYFAESNYGGSSYAYVQTPQTADVLAISSIYGASTTTRLGDTIYGFHASDSFFDFSRYAHAPALTLIDGGGSDTLDVSDYSQNQSIDLQPGHYSSVGGLVNNIGISTDTIIENAIGGSGDDTLTGNSSNNLLDGRGGINVLIGGGGNDLYIINNVNDHIVENVGEGTDQVIVTVAGYTLADNVEIGSIGTAAGCSLIGNAAGSTLIGNIGSDLLVGNNGNDFFDGRGGGDTMIGGGGDDLYIVNNINDHVIENAGEGTDHVIVAVSGYTMAANIEIGSVGTAAGCVLKGNTSSNTLIGNIGNDVLDGGAGNDSLWGGAGADSFVFHINLGRDVVNDFVPGEDKLLFDHALSANFAEIQGHLAQSGADVLIQFDADNSVLLLNTQVSSLHSSDFLFF